MDLLPDISHVLCPNCHRKTFVWTFYDGEFTAECCGVAYTEKLVRGLIE